MVVAIHTHPFTDLNPVLGEILSLIVTRIGVPFFFAVAGYYYFISLEKGEKKLIPYLWRIIIPYCAWSVAYYIVEYARWGHSNLRGFVIDCLHRFLITGSYYHLWFFPALVFSTIAVTVLWRIKLRRLLIPLSVLLYLLGCLGCAYYQLGVQVPILADLIRSSHFLVIRRIFLLAFPTFTMGYAIGEIKESRVVRNHTPILLISALVIWIAELGIIWELKLAKNYVQSVGLYFLVAMVIIALLQSRSRQNGFSEWCRFCSGIMYFAHPLIMMAIEATATKILHISIGETVLFFLTIAIMLLVGSLLHTIKNKTIRRILC